MSGSSIFDISSWFDDIRRMNKRQVVQSDLVVIPFRPFVLTPVHCLNSNTQLPVCVIENCLPEETTFNSSLWKLSIEHTSFMVNDSEVSNSVIHPL